MGMADCSGIAPTAGPTSPKPPACPTPPRRLCHPGARRRRRMAPSSRPAGLGNREPLLIASTTALNSGAIAFRSSTSLPPPRLSTSTTFLDLTGDGKPGASPREKPTQPELSLLCFSHDAELLWQFEPGREVRTTEVAYPRTYHLRAMTPVTLKRDAPLTRRSSPHNPPTS